MLHPIKSSAAAAIVDSFGEYLGALESVRTMPLAAVVAELAGKSDVEPAAMRHLAEQLGIEPLIVRMTASRILSAHGRLAVVRAFGPRQGGPRVPGMTAAQLEESAAIRSLVDRGYSLRETGDAATALESIGAPITVAMLESTIRKMREAG